MLDDKLWFVAHLELQGAPFYSRPTEQTDFLTKLQVICIQAKVSGAMIFKGTTCSSSLFPSLLTVSFFALQIFSTSCMLTIYKKKNPPVVIFLHRDV